jgi:hypothetical protein
MPTNQRPIEGLHAEVYAPIGGFVFGVSKFGDSFGINNAFVFGVSKFGDSFGDSESKQWVDYISDATNISYNRGSISEGAGSNAQVGLLNITLKNAGNPLDDYKIRAGRKVRIRYNDEQLFNGTLVKSAGRFLRKRNNYTKVFSIQVTDAVKKLAGLKAYGMGGLSEPFESFEQRIARILDTYDGPVLLPTGDAYPEYRLSATVYEGSLAAHLDLACNSVGASWYIDKLGQVRFVTALTDYVLATFTDGSHTEIIDQPFAYWNLQIEYDNKNHLNYLEIANKDIQEDPANPGNAIALETSNLFSDGASVKANGILKETLVTTLYDEGAYDGSIIARANEILNAYKDPQPAIQKIYFNIQENFLATQLETLHRVDVWLEGVKYNLRVTGINATIDAQAKEWLIELDVIKEI